MFADKARAYPSVVKSFIALAPDVPKTLNYTEKVFQGQTL
jgi:hypothetical protein